MSNKKGVFNRKVSRREALKLIGAGGLGLYLAGRVPGVAAASMQPSLSSLKHVAAPMRKYKFPAEGKPYAGTKINVSMVAEAKPDALKKVLSRFTEKTGIEVNLDILPYPTLQEKQFTVMTQQTGALDGVHVDCVWMGQYAGQGWISPVDDLVAETDPDYLMLEDFHPAILSEQCMWEEKLYGLPFINAIHTLYYRTDIFDKHGLKPPETWEELREAAKLITEAESKNGVYGVTFMGKRGVQLLCTYVNFLGAFGSYFYDKNYVATLDSPEAIAALEFFKSLIPYANPGVLSQDWDECFATFAAGNAAMNIQWQNAAPGLADPSKSQIVGKWGITLTPGNKLPDGTIRRSPTFGGWCIGIATDSKNREAVWEFMLWATSLEMERELAYAMPSSRKSVLGDPEFQKKYIEYETMLKSYDYAMGRPRIPEWPQMADLIEAALSEAMTGAKTPEQALKDVNPLLNEILMSAGYQKT
jgi:multiple sugar transport system substrate-binding protein